MEGKQFRYKIIIIFIIPILAMIYPVAYLISNKQTELKEALDFVSYSQRAEKLSQTIRNLQLERGLSAGYIVAKDKEVFKSELLSQYKKTDVAIKNMRLDMKSTRDSLKMKGPYIDNALRASRIMLGISKIDNTRKNILHFSSDFNDIVSYYSDINADLIDAIQVFLSYGYHKKNHLFASNILEKLKEYAGIERAYIYNCILSRECNSDRIQYIRTVIGHQYNLMDDFAGTLDDDGRFLVRNLIDRGLNDSIEMMRKLFFSGKLSDDDARRWFVQSTKRIEALNKITASISKINQKKARAVYSMTKKSLSFTFFMLSLVLVAILFLVYILSRLIKEEERVTHELKIASYAFDSQEAMSITDPDGIILRTNRAFETITGYKEHEVIGKTPKILKSGRHSKEFYENMWRDIAEEGKWSGEVRNRRKNGEEYVERLAITAIKDQDDKLTHYIAQFLDITDMVEARKNAVRQANHDFLTSLPNRKYLISRLPEVLDKSRKEKSLSAFLFLDIDDFKKVNDRYGHAAGDMLLVEVSRRLKALVHSWDMVARFSGDEFCIILNTLKYKTSKEEVENLCAKILLEMSRDFVLDTNIATVGMSIGARIFPDEGDTPEKIIADADAAMYIAKNMSKNRFVLVDEKFKDKIREANLLERDIENGFSKGEFIFYYQPKVDTRSGKIKGAELLSRWEKDGEVITPDKFIRKIKDMNMIDKLTMIALQNACSFLGDNGGTSLVISLNVTAKELIRDDFVQKVEKVIGVNDTDPAGIEFEIIEDELINDFDKILPIIYRLKSLGFRFAIDDFGAGYSSITYLKKLPIDTLKLDKYFMDDLSSIENRELVQMIIGVAKTFKLTSVIEGIEDRNQLRFVRSCGADQYQGYVFSRPVTRKEFVKILNQRSRGLAYI